MRRSWLIPAWILIPALVVASVAAISLSRPDEAYGLPSVSGAVPPVANAGSDVTGVVTMDGMGMVTLDGAASFDPDGSIVSYAWTEGAALISTQAQESVMLDAGVRVITLTVTDNEGYTATDKVSVSITVGPLNPDPYYCFDVTGNGSVDVIDLQQVAASNGKRFGQPGYTRLKDWNVSRTIDVIDLMGTAQDFTTMCPLEDRQIRASTAAIEKYQNVNQAIADGYVQVTQFIPQMGRHMVKSSLYDTTFDPAVPEGLLYEPDSSSPGGWRLGGALYVVPIPLSPLLPAGFAGTDDGWHFHEYLCFYPNGTVTLDPEPICSNNGGTSQTNVGWLVHLWNYVPAPSSLGRYAVDNPNLVGLP